LREIFRKPQILQPSPMVILKIILVTYILYIYIKTISTYRKMKFIELTENEVYNIEITAINTAPNIE